MDGQFVVGGGGVSAAADRGDRGSMPPVAGLRRGLALLSHMRRTARGRLAAAFALLVVATALESLSVLLLIPLLHLAERGGGAVDLGAIGDAVGALSWLPAVSVPLGGALVALIALVAGQALLGRARATHLTAVLEGFTNAVRLALLRAIGEARWSALAGARAAELEHALIGETDRVQACGFLVLSVGQTVAALAVYGALALLVSVPMTLLSALIGLILLAMLAPFRRTAARFGERATANRGEQHRTVAEFLGSLKAVKALNAEARYADRLQRTLDGMAADAGRHARRSATGNGVFQIGSAVALAMFAWLAVGPIGLSLAQIVVFVVLFARVTPRFMTLQAQAQQLLVALPAYDRVRHLTAAFEAEREAPAGAAPAPRLRRELRFEGVSFRYGGAERDALAGVDLALPAGGVTALIGPSGAGKSTLADLALGLLAPTGGRVLIDAVPLDGAARRAWRDRVAYVPQDVVLLHDTVRANLLIADPGASEPRMLAALRAAGVLDVVERLPGGLDGVVGERGTALSGGERQRIAIARALLRSPDLLILDEATSAVDWQSQRAIGDAVLALRGVTVLLIAHRPGMVALADRVIALVDGKVAEDGSPTALGARPLSLVAGMMAGEAAAGARAA